MYEDAGVSSNMYCVRTPFVRPNLADHPQESTAALQNSQVVFISKLTADHMVELDNTTLYDAPEIPMDTCRSDVVISIEQVQKMLQRGFLWAGRAAANGGHCHVNWSRVCRPIELGGLGVRDLKRDGLALRLRWLWFSRTDPERAWQGLDLQFSPTERALFWASTFTILGNGLSALLWEDRWIGGRSVRELMPNLYGCIPKRRRTTRTVADGLNGNSWARDIQGNLGLHEIGQYLQLWQIMQRTELSTAPDKLIWRWTASGSYSAQSCYTATFHGATACHSWKLIWKCWAPPRVKFFHWLANQDRCWTAERLARHGLQHHPRCLLCDQQPETVRHLMLECPLTRQAWHETLAWLRIPAPIPSQEPSLTDWWRQANEDTPPTLRKALKSVALLVPWMVWKHRNSCVFDNAMPSLNTLLDSIRDEARSWAAAAAPGLRLVLPQTWDVH
ncbi:hypothetical protein VPH35_059197 [Triticum aestivum]|uniref:Reverse transcriptase zinc-binding domain-containing protein n=3 Tax=Aegilops tauschii subsp. strangulata TaxID=200361 RepID=A0A453EJS5_AEGTS